LSELASSQISMAGSVATAWVKLSKSPGPSVRKSWFWPYMYEGNRTFDTAVGKWPWRRKANFSRSGLVVATMRASHQLVRATV